MSELTLWCLLVNNAGDRVGTAFEVTIASSSNVAGLATNIITSATAPIEVTNWRAANLAIWKPTDDLPDDDHVLNTVRGWCLNHNEVNDRATLLSPSKKLCKVFDQGLAEECVHVIVQLLNSDHPSEVSSTSLLPPADSHFEQCRIFRLENTANYDHPPANSLALNGITEHIGNLPASVVGFSSKLKQKRVMRSDSQMMQMGDYVQVERFFELKEASENDDPHTVVQDDEMTHFTDIFRDEKLRNLSGFQRSKEPCIHALLWNLTLALSGRNSFLFQWSWPFQLAVSKLDDNAREKVSTYTPRSDASLLVDGYPHMLMEIMSRPDECDCFRMLLQAACLVRLSNALRRTKKDPFIMTAIYIDSKFYATRYLLWQPENHGTDVRYTSEEFNLGNAQRAFDFVFQLYNLAACTDMQHNYLRSKLDIKAATLRFKDLPSLTAHNRQKSHKRGRGDDNKDEDGQPSPKRSKKAGDANESMAWVDEVIVNAGYEVVGGKLGSSLPLSKRMREGRSSNNMFFVFKLVERKSDELEILKYLKKHRGSDHHIIELHEVISDGLDNIIVLPRLTPLSEALRRLNKFALATVPQQFLEGVQFMHQHNVAHLDLKTDNIVIEQSGPSGRLTAYIIDFDCSMMVEGVETTIKDMYGTPGWMAPEVSATRSYSPILADRWACGNVLLQLGNHLKLSVGLEKFSRELMSTDPRSRPVLPFSGIVPP
ncbi:hypothetical protein JB92DRAFT_2818527 [Gautieria morchelliformis]|nr:hypothetical protein JB92DRAFT_2818527 [Gautieria morchelliformis]